MTTQQQLADALKVHFGFDSFKGNQQEIMLSLMDGNDVFVLMPTGGGKSLCYQLPSLLMEGTAIVISPLIALMKNQVDAMRNFSTDDGIAHFLNSSLNRSAIDQVKTDVASGKTKLLYVAPESLTKEENIEFLKTVPISFYAVDEAHCISEWGHDFRPEYRRIRPIINEIGVRPVIALTATATPKVQHDIQKNLGMTKAKVFKSSFNRPNLYYEIRPKTANTDRDIIKFIKNREGKSGIIYCLSRKKVEELAELLKINNIKALPYHAGMDAVTRSENQDAFLLEKVNVIVATIAFGMGIDKPDVRLVIHYDLPPSLEEYYQEAGRAGRDGKPSFALVIASRHDHATLMRRLSEAFPPRDFIKEIYSQVCVSLGIAVGDGYNAVYEFDLEEFCRRFHRQPRMTRSAIELLARSGYWQYVDDVASRARIMITLRRDELYGLRLDPRDDAVLQLLLRTYTGLFADFVDISETQMARRLGLTPDEVYQSLLSLGRHHIASYVPASNRPYIYFLTSRDEQRYLQIPVSVYERRREVMKRRLNAMASFVFDASGCRVARMLRYFGESDASPCGRCDICRRQRSESDASRHAGASVQQAILYLASQPGGHTADYMASQLRVPVKELIPTLRRLLDDGVLRLQGINIVASAPVKP